VSGEQAIDSLVRLRQHQTDGRRAPHKPLLVLLALGRLDATGSSSMDWSLVEEQLGRLLAEFGTSSTGGATSVAYPFTRLRADGVWQLSRDVPDDKVGPLRESPIEGRFTPDIESELRASPLKLRETARSIVERQFPATIASDILLAAGLNPDVIMGYSGLSTVTDTTRRRDPSWRQRVVEAWDRSCAFCGFDGALAGAPVGIEAAHIRWFNFDGPDEMTNGLALCSLHHKLLDRGVLGFRDPQTVTVSSTYSATSEQGRQVYDLHGRRLSPRPGTRLPAEEHVDWHRTEVFKGAPLC